MRFTVPGTPVSANRVTRRVGNKSLKSKEAREYQARVASRALSAMLITRRGALMERDVRVVITAWNVRLDIDNISKTILDGMQKIVYKNDRQVTDLHIEKARDGNGQLIEVEVFEL